VRYDRTIIAYHGCDAGVAERLLRGEPFHRSENDYDWLGAGVYFWEYGADRALRFAQEQQRRGRLSDPAVVGALVQLGNCFDLMDTRFTAELARAYDELRVARARAGAPLPINAGATPDQKLRRLDCWILNTYFVRASTLATGSTPCAAASPKGRERFPAAGSSGRATSRSR
jgi:hypothetical protein